MGDERVNEVPRTDTGAEPTSWARCVVFASRSRGVGAFPTWRRL